MTPKTIIQRVGLASGIALIAASGVVVAAAAAGTASSPHQVPAKASCTATQHPTGAGCRWEGSGDRHARSGHHHGAVSVTASRSGHDSAHRHSDQCSAGGGGCRHDGDRGGRHHTDGGHHHGDPHHGDHHHGDD